jgi:hypothetical protein
MNMDFARPRHWTDDELIDHIYGIGPGDGHLNGCGECRNRFSKMEMQRAMSAAAAAEVGYDFLAAQRRSVYARIVKPARWWRNFHVRRWASALATGGLLAAGLFYYENKQRQHQFPDQFADAQLAQEVSNMARDSESSPTAPLQELFEQ